MHTYLILPAQWDLEFDPSWKDFIKSIEGYWNSNLGMWYIPDEELLTDDLRGYIYRTDKE